MKTDVINARIEPELKSSAEKIFKSLGMSTTDAISIFLSQVVLNQGLPFAVKIPNAVTRAAVAEVRSGKGKKYASSKALMDELGA